MFLDIHTDEDILICVSCIPGEQQGAYDPSQQTGWYAWA